LEKVGRPIEPMVPPAISNDPVGASGDHSDERLRSACFFVDERKPVVTSSQF